MTGRASTRVSLDGLGVVADGVGDGQIRLDPRGDGTVAVTVMTARGTFSSHVRLTALDVLALAEKLTEMSGL